MTVATHLLDQLFTVMAALAEQSPEPVVAPPEVMAALAVPTRRPARATTAKSAAKRTSARQAAPPPPSAPPAPAIDLSGCDLAELARRAAVCTRCPLHAGRTNPVFADGSPAAALMFIGEGPGGEEDRLGKPFVGRSGQLLDKMIVAMQFRREEVYIANIVKCRPPGNRAPQEDEARACLPYLLRQIELVKPQVIVLLGATATTWLLGKTGISKLRGHWHEFHGIRTMPTFHPAYLLRNPPAKAPAWSDLQQVMRVLGKDPRQTSAAGSR